MRSCQQANIKKLRHAWLVAVILCMLFPVVFVSNEVQNAGDALCRVVNEPVFVAAGVDGIPNVDGIVTETKSNGHFTVRSKNAVKLLMKKSSATMLGLFQFQFIKLTIRNQVARHSFAGRSGYYLFLFRYVLF